ncbi:MAG: GntR family transcriptional regulator [Phycisphaerae bacterium]
MASRQPTNGTSTHVRLSYKFQRLREELRQAIETGEFEGRLPGERDLGRRFHANAKTINKALSDLSAEGLVVRFVGRGTFVAGATGRSNGRESSRFWWVGADPDDGRDALAFNRSRERFAEADSRDELIYVPPSDLNGNGSQSARSLRDTDGIVLWRINPTARIMAGLLRRQIPLVAYGGECDATRVNAVMADDAEAGFRLTEHLVQLGYRRVHVIGSDDVAGALHRVMTGYHAACRRRQIQPQPPKDRASLPRMMSEGASDAMIAVGPRTAQDAVHFMRSTTPPHRPALACLTDPGDKFAEQQRVTSYDVPMERVADWIVRLLHEFRPGQPPVQVVVPGRVMVRDSTRRPMIVRDVPCPSGDALI